METPQEPPSDPTERAVEDAPQRSPIPWLVGGFLALLVTFLGVNVLVSDDTELPDGDPPPEVAFDLLDGGTSSFVAHRGTPIVVNFFASWCAPCVRELPDIEAAAQTYAGQIDFIGLSVSDRESDTRALLESVGVTFEVGLDPNGTIHREVSDLGVMPTTLFVAADGTLVSTHAGAITAGDLDQRIRTDLLGLDSDAAAGG